MDELDIKIQDILKKDFEIPISTHNVIIQTCTNATIIPKHLLIFRKIVIYVISLLFMTTGIVFAKNIIENSFNLGKGVDRAINEGYLEETNMNYINSTIVSDDNTLNNTRSRIKSRKFFNG